MDKWIDSIDGQLSDLRDEEARLRYDADLDGNLDVNALTLCAERQRQLLQGAGLDAKVQQLRDTAPTPRIRRKCDLLLARIRLSVLDEDPEVSRARNDLEHQLYAFRPTINGEVTSYSRMAEILATSCSADNRRAAHLSMKPHLEKVEPLCKRFLKAANLAANRLGMSNYAEAKMSCEDTDLGAFRRMCKYLRRQWLPVWREFLSDNGDGTVHNIQPWDISYLLSGATREVERDVDYANDIDQVIMDTLSLLGLDRTSLPVSIEFRPIPHCGAVHPLEVGGDIRVVIREGTCFSSFGGWSTLFHELGHAIYYCYAPRNTVLLLDGRIGRESLAEMWARLIETPEWFASFVGCTPEQAERVLEIRHEASIIKALGYAREALFELELFLNPDADFAETWRTVSEEFLGISDTSGVYSECVGTYPMDIKDYVYARVIADAIAAELRAACDTRILSPETMNRITQQYYGNWNVVPWNVRLPGVPH